MKKTLEQMKKYLFTMVQPLNDSKIFAGLVILTLNLSSKMITLPMSRTVESVIKHSFSQYVLVFAIAWMGTREVLIATTVTIIFAICMELLFNEKSSFCCLSENFVNNKLSVLESFEGNPDILSKEEIDGAVKTLEKAQRLLTNSENNPSK
tara:strand:+ start:165 stop:617 length:453 start_codon:yes stop_codon:yes gene_type:complete